MATARPFTSTNLIDANSSNENVLVFLESERNHPPKRRHSITNCQHDYNQETNGNSKKQKNHPNSPTLENSYKNRSSKLSSGQQSHNQMCSNFENQNSQFEDENCMGLMLEVDHLKGFESNFYYHCSNCKRENRRSLPTNNHNKPSSSFDYHNENFVNRNDQCSNCTSTNRLSRLDCQNVDQKRSIVSDDLEQLKNWETQNEDCKGKFENKCGFQTILDNQILENILPNPEPTDYTGQSKSNESKSKTGNLDRKLLINAANANCDESKKTEILDRNRFDIKLLNQTSKNSRPKSLTLDYRYLKKAKNPDDDNFGDSRRFLEKSDQFENRFFCVNNDEKLLRPNLTKEPFRSNVEEFGRGYNYKIEHLKHFTEKCKQTQEFDVENECLYPPQSNLVEFGQNCNGLNEHLQLHTQNSEEISNLKNPDEFDGIEGVGKHLQPSGISYHGEERCNHNLNQLRCDKQHFVFCNHQEGRRCYQNYDEQNDRKGERIHCYDEYFQPNCLNCERRHRLADSCNLKDYEKIQCEKFITGEKIQCFQLKKKQDGDETLHQQFGKGEKKRHLSECCQLKKDEIFDYRFGNKESQLRKEQEDYKTIQSQVKRGKEDLHTEKRFGHDSKHIEKLLECNDNTRLKTADLLESAEGDRYDAFQNQSRKGVEIVNHARSNHLDDSITNKSNLCSYDGNIDGPNCLCYQEKKSCSCNSYPQFSDGRNSFPEKTIDVLFKGEVISGSNHQCRSVFVGSFPPETNQQNIDLSRRDDDFSNNRNDSYSDCRHNIAKMKKCDCSCEDISIDMEFGVLIDVDSGFKTTPNEDLLGFNETMSSENEAMDVLLQLDEVLNECLKGTGEANSLVGHGDDFVNKNHDEYRLSRQISLEELEGKTKDRDDVLSRKDIDLEKMGCLGFGSVRKHLGEEEIDDLVKYENKGSIKEEINFEDCRRDDLNSLPRMLRLGEFNIEDSEICEDYNNGKLNQQNCTRGLRASNFSKSEGCENGNSINEFSGISKRVVKLQELEGTNSDGSSNQIVPTVQGEDVNRSSMSRDVTIEECLHDLDEYLRAFDDESCGSKSYCNLGYINNELDKTESDTRRPLSSCGSRAGALTRNHAYRATIGAIKCGGGEERAMVLHRSAPGHVDNPSARRTSAADGDEVIDWSWLNDVEGAENVGIVEEHRPSTSVVVEDSMATGDAKRPIWLRTSMRRLQPLPLPTNVDNADHAPATSSAMDNLTPADTSFTAGTGRPISAPSRLPSVQRSRSRDRTSQNPAGRARSSSASSRSRRPRSLSSSVSSVVSSVDSTPTCTPIPAQTYNTNTTEEANNNNNVRRSCERPARNNDMPEAESPLGQWPHSLSSTLAYIGCTLGIFNISRFAILSVHFGANFIFQFLIITFFIGLPIFTLQLCLGQQLGAGVIDMWKISPMFQGVGVSLLFFQALTGIYSIIGTSWMFVYFRDSFVTKFERYRWAEPFIYYRNDVQPPINGSYKLTETIPDYLSGIVFQRHHLVSGNTYGTIKFQPAFNLAVVWMIVFVSLSKGLRSYGKVIYVFTLLPIFGMFVLCAKLLGMMPPELINNVFPETSWNEFFINPRSWLAACQEVFLTWGMLGAAVMQIASHNKNKHLLQRDSSLIAVITVTILLLAAFLANTCVQILKVNGFSYQPDSFEKLSTYTFMRHKSDPLPPNLASTPVKYMVHNSFIVGDRINRPGYDSATESGYQVLRFATELIPATFAILGTDQVSPFWTVLFYFILILFGIAQQLAIWHCVITGIMAIKAKVLKSWETTITFFSCACGFILGLPMTTEFGIYVVYFMDLAIGGVWWLILILLLQIIAVFMVRGRPYSGDTLVTVLFHSNNYKCLLSWAPALLSFTWNVVLPVVLMVWCIAFFKNGNFRELFIWHHGPSLEYWPLWARQIGALLQLLPILAVPFIAVIQSYRYLNSGPNDILDRIQLLYRPPIGEHMDDLAIQEAAAAINNNTTSPTTNIVAEDPPPKYTPPPSYTTATGARIAKMLRQSIRRSVRRIANVLGESSGARSRNTPTTSQTQEPPPPDYNAVLVEMNQNQRDISITIPDSRNNTIQRELATIATSSTGLTAADVACILRSSFRRSTLRTLRRNNAGADQSMSSLSAENLIDSAAPIGETSLVFGLTSDSDNKDGNNTSSVI